MRPLSRHPSLLANLCLAGLAVAVTLLALEGALRLLHVETASFHSIVGFTVYDPVLGWRLAPSRTAQFRGAAFGTRVVQNADGLRDRTYARDRAPGRRRILVLGDSVVWCWGVEIAECFTERLEAMLPDTDVINAGVPGWGTGQEMLFYEHDGRAYRPDLVVLVIVPNDPTDNVEGTGPRFTLDGDRLRDPDGPAPRRKSPVTQWLQANSRLFAQTAYGLALAGAMLRHPSSPAPAAVPGTMPASAPAPTFVADHSPSATPAWRLTEALEDRLLRAVRADGARLVVVLEVMPRRMKQWQVDLWAARGVPVLDLAPVLLAAQQAGVVTRLPGDPHLSSAGQAVFAEALRGVLERERLLDR